MVGMKSALWKDIIRDIKKSRGRFLSIMCIVALGVAFFSGVKVSPMVMRNTSDKYFDDNNLMDIRLVSTLGLTDKDVEEIVKIDSIEGILPTYSLDVLAKYSSQEKVFKIHALPLEDIKKESKDYINRVNVLEGRLPQKSGECVVEKSKIDRLGLKIGDKLNLKSGTDESLTKSLNNSEYKVVGFIETPYYLSHDKGSSSIGSGIVNGVIMIPQSDFIMDAYTDIFLTVKGAKDENSYTDEYFDIVDKTTNKLKDISDSRIKSRYKEVRQEAYEELDKGKKEFEQNKVDVNKKLDDAQRELDDYKQKISTGEKQLKIKKLEVQSQIKSGKSKISNAEKQLIQGEKEYEKNLKLFNQNKTLAENEFSKAEVQINELGTKIAGLKNLNSTLETRLNDTNLSESEKEIIKQEMAKNNAIINSIVPQYESSKNQLNSKKQELVETREKLKKAKNDIVIAKNKLQKEKSTLDLMESKSKVEFKKAENELSKQKNRIKEAEYELIDNRKKAKDELQKAENKIIDAEDKIAKIEKPEWYVLDRNSHYSYREYSGCAKSIDALSGIFPVFFFSVAALVCLTTMTRMVDEQRINIGTLKGLGYTTWKIAQKYIIYSLAASLIGSAMGLLIGYTLFPTIIFDAYGMMYNLPKAILTFNIPLALNVTITSIAITTLSAYLACYKELKESPSVLMRPKAPKNGKRILLERVDFIWNKIGFIGKVTIRNIFRYKKRFLMTVLGVAGCTALILTGFGIRDSIQMIVDGQYGTIFKYDMTITLDNNPKLSDIDKLSEYIQKDNRIEDYQFINQQNGKLRSKNSEKDVSILVPSDIDDMSKLIQLQDRKSKESIKLGKNGIVITEKIARELDIKTGDIIEVVNSSDKKVKAEVMGIAENYVSHYAYMSEEYYNKLFGRKTKHNTVIATLRDTSKNLEESLSKDIIRSTNIKGVSYNTAVKETFGDTIKNLNYVVLIMILSAGSLAFVVLYNLTNVNISERIREIATIKVLGFYDNEVSAYIYRENIILTVIGSFVGLGLGKLLHQFIMITVEVENMMFGRVISIKSYLIAFVLTIVMGVVVNLAMYYKLKQVQMVESLKSVD